MNIFRVPFLMERLVPGDMTSDPDSINMKALKSVSIHIVWDIEMWLMDG